MFKNYIERFAGELRKLHGDPHYVALGMGVGVFIAVTPTIPFHTVLAIFIAVVFKASKPAAYLGVWICNPLTVIFFYAACYKTGFLLFNETNGGLDSVLVFIGHLKDSNGFSQKIVYVSVFLKTQLKTFMIMNVGGIILAFPASAAAYFITKRFVVNRQARKSKRKQSWNM